MSTQPAHFAIICTVPNALTVEETFATHEEAYVFLTSDPLLSANENHPYFWGNFFTIIEVDNSK